MLAALQISFEADEVMIQYSQTCLEVCLLSPAQSFLYPVAVAEGCRNRRGTWIDVPSKEAIETLKS